jgi:hypothetical protein
MTGREHIENKWKNWSASTADWSTNKPTIQPIQKIQK